jgi:hypothetical protein
MKKLKVLTVIFDTEIKNHEINGFRSAVIEQAGRKHDMFHNHTLDSKSIFRYPLIQYKKIGKNPAIVCLGEGNDQIHHFFENKGQVVIINGAEHSVNVRKLYMNEFTLQVWDKSFNYRLSNWLPFNEKNYVEFLNADMENMKIGFLNKILTGNLLSLAKGIGWHVDKQIEANVQLIKSMRFVKYKEAHLMSFDVDFTSNVFLPNYLVLGKGVSRGFGVVFSGERREKSDKAEMNEQ